MARIYGSLSNRFEENKIYKEIKVGEYATEYFWSDRHAYEITKVVDKKHFFIRRLKAIRIDHNGMSECQEYRYEHDPKASDQEIEITKKGFKRVYRYDLDLYNAIMKRDNFVLWSQDIVEAVKQGKKVKRSSKINLSIGVADEYYDFSF